MPSKVDLTLRAEAATTTRARTARVRMFKNKKNKKRKERNVYEKKGEKERKLWKFDFSVSR